MMANNVNMYKFEVIEGIIKAIDFKTKEEVVVYRSLSNNTLWVRPLTMFLSEVDHEKYPEVLQKYRFELIEE